MLYVKEALQEMPPWGRGGINRHRQPRVKALPGPKHHGGLKPVHPIPGA
ncbi:hypothetical protein ACLK1T_26280 [Escherichia coli]